MITLYSSPTYFVYVPCSSATPSNNDPSVAMVNATHSMRTGEFHLPSRGTVQRHRSFVSNDDACGSC